MCTKNLKEISGPKFAWKVVSINHWRYPGQVISHCHYYRWRPNKTHFPGNREIGAHVFQYNVFHCLATREQARYYWRRWGHKKNDKIIRVKLTGRVFEGTHSGMGALDGKLAICATEAYWDGKFHR